MKKETTNTTKAANGGECLKSAVMKILGWTELEYCQFQFDQGEAYLYSYVPNPDQYSMAIDNLIKSRIFWNWWKNHWAFRDQTFLKLSIVLECKEEHMLRHVYTLMHSADKLTKSIHPNRVVLEQSYADMIHEAVKQEVRKS